MAKYILKSETDLRWNAIRRAATARIDLETKTWRERRLNEVLDNLWQQFSAALNRGDLVELEPEYEIWVRDAVESRPQVGAGDAAS